MLKYRLQDPLFHNNIYLMIGLGKNQLDRYLEKKCNTLDKVEKKNALYANYSKIENKQTGWSEHYITVEKFSWKIEEQALLVHEIFHATMSIFEDAGAPYVRGADNEPHAYYLSSLLEQIYKKLMQFHPNIKRKKKLAK